MGREVIFSRKKKETKLESIQGMTTKELLSLGEDVFYRILKEIGEGAPRERARRLPLQGRPGNDWNSEVLEIFKTTKGKIYFSVYHQLHHTDTTLLVPFSEFMSPGDWRGRSSEMDRYGGETTVYCTYTPDDKAGVIREILREYVSQGHK